MELYVLVAYVYGNSLTADVQSELLQPPTERSSVLVHVYPQLAGSS